MAQLRRKSASSSSKKMNNPIANAMNRAKHSSFYHDLSLRGKHPLRLLGTPQDLWPGSVTAGTQIVGQKFIAGGHILENPNHDQDHWPKGEIWFADNLNEKWQEYLHSFDWLKDLNQAVDRASAKSRAEELVETWIEQNTQWGEISWRADIVGRRIINWLVYAPLIMDSEELIYRSRGLDILARSARHLFLLSSSFPDGPDGLQAILGLIFSGLYLPDGEKWFKEGLALFKFAIGKEILVDGGLRSRNPHELLKIFMNMEILRTSFIKRDIQPPNELEKAVVRMAGNLRSMIHGDGKLALFNGAYIQNNEDIFSVLLKFNEDELSTDAPRHSLEQSGFCRIENGETVILQDVGPPAALELSRACHVGALSFEMSRGTQRMIVNCGDAGFIDETKDQTLFLSSRSTRAHSTLILNNYNNSEIRDDGLIGRGITSITSQRYEENNHVLLEASHNGYAEPFGLSHRRLIYVNERGDDIRGEDILKRTTDEDKIGSLPFDIRFHLHPSVVCSVGDDETTVLIELGNGEKWIFRTKDVNLALEESDYFGEGGAISQSHQIVLSENTQAVQTKVLWSLSLYSMSDKAE